MNEGSYTISVRVFHRTRRANEIVNIIGRRADVSRDIGEIWTTPKGRVLMRDGQPRIATETFCTFRVIEGKLKDFGDGLAAITAELVLRREMPELARSGEVQLFIGLFMDSAAGFNLPAALVQRLADLGISIAMCLYPPIQDEAGDGGPQAVDG